MFQTFEEKNRFFVAWKFKILPCLCLHALKTKANLHIKLYTLIDLLPLFVLKNIKVFRYKSIQMKLVIMI